MSQNSCSPCYRLGQMCTYMLRLGTAGFGGPVALVGYMHRDLVEQRKWISESEYREGLTLAQLMPGPLAAQLAISLSVRWSPSSRNPRVCGCFWVPG